MWPAPAKKQVRGDEFPRLQRAVSTYCMPTITLFPDQSRTQDCESLSRYYRHTLRTDSRVAPPASYRGMASFGDGPLVLPWHGRAGRPGGRPGGVGVASAPVVGPSCEMSLLPIVRRELRVAARKRITFWLRVASAITAVVLGSGCMLMGGWQRIGTAQMGSMLFYALTWTCLAAALSAGLFFTSDCLSEEKREGTLGFLFLTDLRGHDVVLGKLLATSLRVFYALLAVFPILAIALIMGGVTGAQFWKTSLALVNPMFVSVAAGLFVSAISRESQKALAATLFLLLLLVAAGPASDGIFAAIKQRAFKPMISLSSPGYLFVTAGAWGRTPFWAALLVNQAVAWTFFGLACLLLPHTWRENAPKRSTPAGTWAYYWKFGGVKTRRGLRRKLIEPNPVLWLACRERWQAVLLWALTILLVSGLAATFAADERWMLWFVWSYVAGACTLVLYLGIASQAGRLFVEAQRSG